MRVWVGGRVHLGCFLRRSTRRRAWVREERAPPACPPVLSPLQGHATSDHTTLLLNCYTKLKDVEKLDAFIQVSGGACMHACACVCAFVCVCACPLACCRLDV